MSEPQHIREILPAITTNSENRFLMEPLLLTPKDAARTLAICERTLYDLTMPRGEIPVIRAGRLVRYSVEDLKTWIKRSSEIAKGA